MIIYGVALLSVSLILGMLTGEALGVMLGVDANVGGGAAGEGIKFWSAMYIPIVVAMAAQQNVAAATDGGMLALVAGMVAVFVSFALVPVISRLGGSDSAAVSERETQ